MNTLEVLVLNNDYEPLNICSLRRAFTLMMLGKAETLHHHESPIRTASGPLRVPSVVRMRYHVKRPLPQLRLSRHTVLARDMYMCQYCGASSRDLTIDHVVPRHKGGPATWDNLVACCRRCNLRKGDKAPTHVGMRLIRPPGRPHYIPYISLTKYLRAVQNDVWRDYLPVFDEFVK